MKQFLKIKPVYQREICIIGNELYIAHFNRGEWRKKNKVIDIVFRKSNGNNVCFIGEENKEELFAKCNTLITDKGKISDTEFYIKVLITVIGVEISRKIIFGFEDKFPEKRDLQVSPTGDFYPVYEMHPQFYWECEKHAKRFLKENRDIERILLFEEEEKKRLLEKAEHIKNRTLATKQALKKALEYPVFFRACQGFLDNSTLKAERRIERAIEEIGVFSSKEINEFLSNIEKYLREEIEERRV